MAGLPHDLDAERALLGAALLDAPARTQLVHLPPDAFYKPTHAHIAAAISELHTEGAHIDAISVHDRLRRQGLATPKTGGLLVEFLTAAGVGGAPRYAEIISAHHARRCLLSVLDEARTLAYRGDPLDAIGWAQAALGNGHIPRSGTASNLIAPDMAALLAADLTPDQPAYLARSDGRRLLYAGRLHAFNAPPESGKSWLALAAGREIIEEGGAVIYLDYEDTEKGIVGRLLALGAHPDDIAARFQYMRCDGPCGPGEQADMARHLDRLNPDLVVIDGVAEALVRDGLSEDSNEDFVTWVEKLPRPLTQRGATVLLLDHTAKNPAENDAARYARGASAKLAVITGAAYRLHTTTEFSRNTAGKVRLEVVKDRLGGVRESGTKTAATATIEPHAGGEHVTINLDAPRAGAPSDPWRPTHTMAMVSAEMAHTPRALTAVEIKALFPHTKPPTVEAAISRLVSEGYLTQIGSGSQRVLRHRHPFSGSDTPTATQLDLDDPANPFNEDF